jgi:hypothetical protein
MTDTRPSIQSATTDRSQVEAARPEDGRLEAWAIARTMKRGALRRVANLWTAPDLTRAHGASRLLCK